jgi:hypothetical protein
LGRRHLDPFVGAPKALVDFNRPAWKPFAANFLSGRIDQNAENLFATRRNERFSPCRRFITLAPTLMPASSPFDAVGKQIAPLRQ